MPQKARPEIVVRTATPEDSLVAGQICFNAFSTISASHNFPCDLPSPEAAVGLLSMMFSSPGFYSVWSPNTTAGSSAATASMNAL